MVTRELVCQWCGAELGDIPWRLWDGYPQCASTDQCEKRRRARDGK